MTFPLLLLCSYSQSFNSLPLPCTGDNRPFTACSAPWIFAGPSGYQGLDSSADDPSHMLSAGAAQAIVQGSDGNWFLGSVNGGVWRTDNISVESPHWIPTTDVPTVPCSSISALATGPDRLVLAGCGGSTSSEMGSDWNVLNNGDWGGVMRSLDNGKTWSRLPGFPVNYYVSSIVVLAGKSDVTGDEVFLVAARSHFFNKRDGGIWRSEDGGANFSRVLSHPVFNLELVGPSTVIAALPFPYHPEAAVLMSTDGGRAFSQELGVGLSFPRDHAPFYPCFAIGGGFLYYGALTVSATNAVDTNSVLYRRPWPHQTDVSANWTAILGGPDPDGQGLDDDSMPKDRMALLVHPTDPTLLFVAGNGDKIAYRVRLDQQTSTTKIHAAWSSLTGNDTSNNAAPHCDCRNFAWDRDSGSLLLVSDGGIFRRTQPEHPGGKWLSSIGDYSAMEFVSAAWDWRDKRWVAGAQDNDVQVAPPNAKAGDVAAGIVLGDGMSTAVDSSVSPSRLWGTRQFLGSRRADIRRRLAHHSNRHEGRIGHTSRGSVAAAMPGFCFSRGEATDIANRVCLDTSAWGFTPEAFPFFYQPYTLNRLHTSFLIFWARAHSGNPAGFWQVQVPSGARRALDVPPPSFISSSLNSDVYDFVAGGANADGSPDPLLIVALNESHLFYQGNVSTNGQMQARSLPVRFARPLTLKYDPKTHQPIIGPVSHGKTISLAVLREDSETVAITGRPSVLDNQGDESVWITRNGGHTWTNVTGNLLAATQTVAKARPSALSLITVDQHSIALLVGTVSGVYVSWIHASVVHGSPIDIGHWSRLGTCSDLPLVLTMGLSYEPHSDTLVVATFGRGIYVMHNATHVLRNTRKQQEIGACKI